MIFISFKQNSILTIAQPIQYESTVAPDSHSITTTISTISYNDDESVYDSNIDNNGEDMYDNENDSSDIQSTSTIVSQTGFDNNITSNEDGDDTGSYQDDDEEDEPQMYGDTMSVNRPTIDSNNKKPVDSQSIPRIPFISSNFWRYLLSKPAILVGIIGGIVIGMLSAILLVMFIIYRMRKKDEGSYALEEAPRKSPSHAYTRVSSKEFFAWYYSAYIIF